MELMMLKGFRYPKEKPYDAYSLRSLHASHAGENEDIDRDA